VVHVILFKMSITETESVYSVLPVLLVFISKSGNFRTLQFIVLILRKSSVFNVAAPALFTSCGN